MSLFTDFCATFFQKYFDLHPTEAIYYGVDGYDHLLNDFSDETYQEEKRFLHNSLVSLKGIPRESLDQDEAIDYALLEGRLRIDCYEYEKEDYRLKSPDRYLPADAIYILTVRASNDFSGNLLSRVERAPHVLQQGIANLSRPEANPPRLWTEMAITAAHGAISFLRNLPVHPKVQAEFRNPAALQPAVDKAIAAIQEFAGFLERDLVARSRGAYAVGEEHYNLLLKNKHFLDFDARSLLRLGESLFARTKEQLSTVAKELEPRGNIDEVARRIQEQRPSPDELLAAYRRAMQSAREFVKANQLVSFPPREELYIVPTPEFRRHEIPFAAYLSPSPKDPNQVGYYYVTPVTDDELLREHNWVGLENTSVHESYPGHHLQFSVANSIPAASTLARLMNESSVFYEGWALYCEQLMQEQGFLNSNAHRFVMLKDRLWRALRIIIDVKTQNGLMTYDEAAELMVRELHFPREQACADLNWYSQAPSIPMGYALGWSIINRLREQEQSRLGKRFDLCAFHNRLLSAGSIALPLVEKRNFTQT